MWRSARAASERWEVKKKLMDQNDLWPSGLQREINLSLLHGTINLFIRWWWISNTDCVDEKTSKLCLRGFTVCVFDFNLRQHEPLAVLLSLPLFRIVCTLLLLLLEQRTRLQCFFLEITAGERVVPDSIRAADVASVKTDEREVQRV